MSTSNCFLDFSLMDEVYKLHKVALSSIKFKLFWFRLKMYCKSDYLSILWSIKSRNSPLPVSLYLRIVEFQSVWLYLASQSKTKYYQRVVKELDALLFVMRKDIITVDELKSHGKCLKSEIDYDMKMLMRKTNYDLAEIEENSKHSDKFRVVHIDSDEVLDDCFEQIEKNKKKTLNELRKLHRVKKRVLRKKMGFCKVDQELDRSVVITLVEEYKSYISAVKKMEVYSHILGLQLLDEFKFTLKDDKCLDLAKMNISSKTLCNEVVADFAQALNSLSDQFEKLTECSTCSAMTS